MRIDVHQHLWTERLYAALARRDAPPRLRPHRGGWCLELANEAPLALSREPHDPARRLAVLDDLGADVALVALSTALGIEALPDDEARELIAAWDDDAADLPGTLPAWGSVALRDAPDPKDVDRALDLGRVGLTLPASALAGPEQLDRVGPLLERLAERDAPLFVHPSPATPETWLPALTSYVASLSQAWHAWALHGRERHPELRVLFAALAGLGPLHAERLQARVKGVDVDRALQDPLTFFDTSSYGPHAIEAFAGVVGLDRLVLGSDWPYAEAVRLDAPLQRRIAERNPAALLGRRPATVAA